MSRVKRYPEKTIVISVYADITLYNKIKALSIKDRRSIGQETYVLLTEYLDKNPKTKR